MTDPRLAEPGAAAGAGGGRGAADGVGAREADAERARRRLQPGRDRRVGARQELRRHRDRRHHNPYLSLRELYYARYGL